MSNDINVKKYTIIGILCVICFIGFVWGMAALYAWYNVWSKEMDGRATLAQAEYSRKVLVAESEAKKDAAKFLAEAEIIRAKGVAEANKIIGDSLKNNPDYLKYLFISQLDNKEMQVIYVPTETNIPILEINRNDKEK